MKKTKIFLKTINKIYLVISVILVIGLGVTISYKNHYHKLINKMFIGNGYIAVITNDDYYDKFSKYKSVTKVEKAVFLEPDYSYNTLGRAGYEIWRNGVMIDSRTNEENIRINWEDFFVGGARKLNDGIFILASNDIIDGKISLGLESHTMSASYFYKPISDIIEDLKGESIGFIDENNKIELVIDNVYEARFREMTVSNNTFNAIASNSDLYAYRIYNDDLEEALRIIKKIRKLDDNNIVSLNQDSTNEEEGRSIYGLEQKEGVFTFLSYMIDFGLFIIFIRIKRAVN